MKELTCIVCPNGCRISCETAGDDYLFSGNLCQRGADYARSEMTHPMRTLCTTVKTGFPEVPALPVRTSTPIPKERVFDVVRALKDVCVDTRLGVGDVVAAHILGLDSNIICTSTLLKNKD